jgi:hypothetical protein
MLSLIIICHTRLAFRVRLPDHLPDRYSYLNLLRGERDLLLSKLRCFHGKNLLVYFARKLTFCGVQFFGGSPRTEVFTGEALQPAQWARGGRREPR